MKSKILKTAGITLLVLVSFLTTAPWLFKGTIIRLVKARINKDLRAHVNFSGTDISWFRHFPGLAIGLDSVRVICVGEFQGDTLMTAKQFEITFDIRNLLSARNIRVYSVMLNEPRFHAVVHPNGHANWNSVRPDGYNRETTDTSAGAFTWALQQYAIHNGYLDYLDQRRNMQVTVVNLEHEGRGDFSSERFTLKTKTTADAVHVSYDGTIPYQLTAKTRIDLDFRVDNKTHTYSFNTDQVSFNEMKLHTEGFFQWINDSSYNMNIQYKVPSINFKNVLSLMPSFYRKDFASMEVNGQVHLNGYVKGKYDENHFPAYHTSLYVVKGYIKYPDLPVPVENIRLGLQVDNRDGIADHKIIHISEAHAEIYHDTLDMHLLVKNPHTKPFIDFALVGKLDLANISQCIKLEPGTRWSGLLIADVHAKGKIPGTEKQKKDPFTSWGDFELSDFLYSSKAYPGGITLQELIMSFNPKNVLIQDLKGTCLTTHLDATGSLNNFFDFALGNKPLNATMDIKADELNLRDWMRTDLDSSVTAAARNSTPFIVPGNMDFTINAEAGKLHFDNLDLKHISGKLVISDQTVHLHHVKANGLDGDIALEGTYSTLESREHPEIALNYEVKNLDIQKTFYAFNTIRKIMPVAKFMAGNLNARMSLNGRLHEDMTADLPTLQGEGDVELLSGSLKDFGPMDKLAHSLDIVELRNILLNDVKAKFSFKSGTVVVSSFPVHAKDIDLEIGGTHGFDQSLDYDVRLNVPRSRLGSKGRMFVKNVVTQAADKGIPVTLAHAVSMNVKMGGTINSPDLRTNMDSVVNHAETDLKKEVNDFVNAKLDSAKQQLHHPTAPAKKHLFVQTAYKSKTSLKANKTSKSAHKSRVRSNKKRKKSSGNYTTSLKKEKSTVSNRQRHSF